MDRHVGLGFKPRNEAQAVRVFTWVAAILFAGTTWIIDANTELGSFRTEATGIAVVFIGEASRRRAYLERKQEIIQQMASRNNDFALDAVHIATNEGWLEDGSLQGASLSGANLQNARLSGANFQGAFLLFANLRNADLDGANLQGAYLSSETELLLGVSTRGANLEVARYSSKTIWPHCFDPIAAGAFLEEG